MLNGIGRRPALRVLLGFVTLAAVVGGGARAEAQGTTQLPLQFDFLNPGARSLGMAGAFIGAADDATTASANPAGLATLTRREVSFEARFRRAETPFLRAGRVSGTPTGIGADTLAGPVYGTDVDSQLSPTFLSFITRIGPAGVAVYRHEAARLSNAFFSEGVFQRTVFAGVTDDRTREIPLGGSRAITVTAYGAAVGLPISSSLAIGGGVSLQTLDLDAQFARYGFVADVFSAPDRTQTTATASQRADDVAMTVNGGLLWTARADLKIGAQFRRGARFAFTQTDDVPINAVHLVRRGHFKVPDVLGVGAEWKVTPNLRVLVDYDRVMYAQIKDDFLTLQSLASGRASQLRSDSGHEVHAGVERLWLDLPKPMAFRAGIWRDPAHAVRYQPTAARDATDTLLEATLPGGKTLVHYTVGAGVVLTDRIELNGAADLSSRTTYVTTSAVIRF